MSALPLTSARFNKLWIPFLNHLLMDIYVQIPLISIFYLFF